MKYIYTVLNFIALSILPTNYAQTDIATSNVRQHPADLQHSNKLPIDEYLPFHDDCSKFIRTDGQNKNIFSCASGTAFDIVQNACDFENKVDCSGRGNPRKVSTEEEKRNIVCPSGDNGLHPYPNDCTKFIECAQGQLYIKDCAPHTGFNKNLLSCDYKYNFECDWNVTGSQQRPANATILCPENTTGIFAFPFDFGKYTNCTNGQTWVQNCAQNYKFSISQSQCVADVNIKTPDFVKYNLPFNNIHVYETLYSCPRHGHSSHLYPYDAAKFINCSNGQLRVEPCGSLTVFGLTSQTCLSKDLVLTSDRVPFLSDLTDYANDDDLRASDILFCSLHFFGLYPHPFDNTKYLKCVYGQLYSHSCRAGYAYSLSRKFCVAKHEKTVSFDILPTIPYNHKEDSKIETRSNDSLPYLNCPPVLYGSFVYPFDCFKYLTCSQGVMRIITCPVGYIYSIFQRYCMLGVTVYRTDHVGCMNEDENYSSHDDASHGVSCSAIGASIHPHPQDWHKYLQCDNGKISVKQCLRNHVFSLTTNQCIQETNEME